MDVVVRDVHVERDGRAVLQIPSLRLRGGRTTAILGPNGSGKTTLLRVIAGLERRRADAVTLGDAAIRPGTHLAYVFQEQVFLRRTVRQNLELGLALRGVKAGQARSRADEAARVLGIPHLMNRRADHLSGGEGRRVGLARALCLRAPLVLLDEPLEGLDERTYSRLLDELPALLHAFDATTVLVTHNRHEALSLAEDLVILVEGKVRAAGDKRTIVMHPRTVAVADVLGYAVLPAQGRRIAVPPGGLTIGTGAIAFAMAVDRVLDLVDRRELVGQIGDVRVHVPVPDGMDAPPAGSSVPVAAARFCEIEE